LYRKDSAGVSFSCNPNGSRSGFDDSVKSHLDVMHYVLDTAHHLPFELKINDTGIPETGVAGRLGIPMFGYADYMARPYNIHIHWREQDKFGDNTFYIRR